MNDLTIEVTPPTLFFIGDIPITNSITSGILLTIIILVLSLCIAFFTKKKGNANSFQVVLEETIKMFEDFVNKITGNEKLTKRILPIIGSLFIYVGISNVLTILPIDWIMVEDVNGNSAQLFRTHTSDVAVAFGIAVSIVIWTQIYSIRKFNIFGHLNKYFKFGTVYKAFRKSRGDGFLSLIDLFLLGPLDLISEIAKSMSLSLRLFGNMLAGVALTALMLAFVPLVAPAFLSLYAIFSGVIQAVVFGALSASYFATAVNES